MVIFAKLSFHRRSLVVNKSRAISKMINAKLKRKKYATYCMIGAPSNKFINLLKLIILYFKMDF